MSLADHFTETLQEGHDLLLAAVTSLFSTNTESLFSMAVLFTESCFSTNVLPVFVYSNSILTSHLSSCGLLLKKFWASELLTQNS